MKILLIILFMGGNPEIFKSANFNKIEIIQNLSLMEVELNLHFQKEENIILYFDNFYKSGLIPLFMRIGDPFNETLFVSGMNSLTIPYTGEKEIHITFAFLCSRNIPLFPRSLK